MREEALRAYLHETARGWRPGAGPAYAARVLRMKTYVTQEATKLCAELFALSGGRHYRRDGRLARTLAASFAGPRCGLHWRLRSTPSFSSSQVNSQGQHSGDP